MGRIRVRSFNILLDRVRSRLSNWKTKLLSHDGKDILLKFVIQVIPTYCMGIFKIPRAILQEINLLMQGFWQGQKDRERKIHWTNWQLMSKTKLNGGLGFKDLEDFILAMLGKQFFRLI